MKLKICPRFFFCKINFRTCPAQIAIAEKIKNACTAKVIPSKIICVLALSADKFTNCGRNAKKNNKSKLRADIILSWRLANQIFAWRFFYSLAQLEKI